MRCVSRVVRAASLLGYPLRRAAAATMLYGGVCVQHLAQPPPPLALTRSESLPPPSLRAERDDLQLEISDGGCVLGLRLSPGNIGARARGEAVRLRSEDCHRRVVAQRCCWEAGVALQFPLPSRLACEENNNNNNAGNRRSYATHFHPPSPKLSLFTRPVDCGSSGLQATAAAAALGAAHSHPRAWRPFQMLKPISHNWSPTLRSSGVRGPHMQLMQERLDGKGFGWKRKSRSLWQQDIDTAGFRPKRFF